MKIEGPTWGSPQAVSSLLVPPLLALLRHPSAPARRGALAELNLMLPSMPDGMLDNMEAFAQGLFSLATDGDSGVRKQVVAGMVGLLPMRPDLLMPQFNQVIEYMLAMHAVRGGWGGAGRGGATAAVGGRGSAGGWLCLEGRG